MAKRYRLNFGTIPSKISIDHQIVFGTPAKDDDYSAFVTITTGVAYWADVRYHISNKTANGFTLTLYNSADFDTGGEVWVDWGIIRSTD